VNKILQAGFRALGRKAGSAHTRDVQVWVRRCTALEEARTADREFRPCMTLKARVAAVDGLRAH
jgi:hypothetical protein